MTAGSRTRSKAVWPSAVVAAALVAAGPSRAAAREDPGTPAADTLPGERSAHALVHHRTLRRTILLGGVPDAVEGGVWGWDGERWSRLGGTDGLGSRGHFALAYDPTSDLLLVHGGFGLRFGADGGARYGDLQAWDGRGWRRLHGEAEGPGVRDHHAMVWDAGRGELVLFGGSRGAPGESELLGDTWIRADGTWRRFEGVGPPARATHRLAYDADRGRVVLFGGWGEDGLLDDTWEWDGEGWRRMEATGPRPAPRFAARLAWDGVLGRVVLFGGRGADGDLGDTWEWDGTAWEPLGSAGPGVRNVHGLAWDPDRGGLVLYGGLSDGARRSDSWERRGRRWLRRLPGGAVRPAPAGRGAAAGGWDPERRRLLVFGGIGAEPRAFGDLWAWSGGSWREVSADAAPDAPSPSPRFNAAAAFLPGAGQLVVHGGGGIDEVRGDTWVWSAGAWREIEGPGPSPRSCARMVARPDRGDAVLFGGAAPDGTLLSDTWRWDGAGWSRLAGDGPPARCFHAMAYDEVRGRVVLFGGRGPGPADRSTWELDAAWRRADRAGPPPRDHHAMAWDPVGREVVLFGGGGRDRDGTWDGTALADTWSWDGARWRRRPDPGAPPRLHAPLLVGGSDGVLLFGGSDAGGSHGDVWRWDGRRWHRVDPGAP